jgi:hypothetical protein
MSSTNERSIVYPKVTSQSEQKSLDKPFQKSNPGTPMLLLTPSKKLQSSSAAALANSSPLAHCELTMLSLSAAQMRRATNSSTLSTFSTPSTKQTTFDIVVPAGQKPWEVELHREVGKDVAGYGLCDPNFTPSLRELFTALRANPKQFPKKKGKLKDTRAADLRRHNVTFRAVFIIEDKRSMGYTLQQRLLCGFGFELTQNVLKNPAVAVVFGFVGGVDAE